MSKKKRAYTDTTVPPVHGDVRDIMAALLKTPPPPAGHPATRKAVKKGKKRKGR